MTLVTRVTSMMITISLNEADNCPVFNPQSDFDLDSLGDLCDPDDDQMVFLI